MKKFLLFAFMAISLSLHAQNEETVAPDTTCVSFGYVSYSALLEAMPDYATAKHKYAQLEEKYSSEIKRVEDEFNAKYEAFLDGQRDFPPTILKKRQSELQELLDKNIAFKAESKRLLAEAEAELMAPLREKLSKVLSTIGTKMDLMFIINTDNDACPFVNLQHGVDVFDTATQMLNQL